MHGLVAALDQQDQEIEVPGNERDLAPLADEEPPLRQVEGRRAACIRVGEP